MLRVTLLIIIITIALIAVTNSVKVETGSNTNMIEKLIENREMIENF